MGKLTANGRLSWGNGQGKVPALTLPLGQNAVLCPWMVSQIAIGSGAFGMLSVLAPHQLSVGKPAVSVLSGECISARHNFWQRLTTCWGTHLPEILFPDRSLGELCCSVALKGTAEKALEVIVALWLACGFGEVQFTVCSQGRK